MKLISVVTILILSFFQEKDELEIKAKLREYDTLVRNKNTKAIALLFTEEASYGYNVKGRKAIEEYLNSFNSINVVGFSSTTTSLKVTGTIASHEGGFKQVVNSKNKILEHTGTYRMTWTKINNEWFISSLTYLTKTTK